MKDTLDIILIVFLAMDIISRVVDYFDLFDQYEDEDESHE
jgi:hypothetical protein